jgi:hypothetical protein
VEDAPCHADKEHPDRDHDEGDDRHGAMMADVPTHPSAPARPCGRDGRRDPGRGDGGRPIYLDPGLDRAMARLAAERGVTKAEAIREALRDAAARVARPRITAIGVGHGPGDVADDVDRHLDETGFGSG